MVELQGQRDGFAVAAAVDVVLQLLLLLDADRRSRGAGGDGGSAAVGPEGDDAVGAAGDERARGRVEGEGPDAVDVVVERAVALAGVDGPDLDEAVAAGGDDLDATAGVAAAASVAGGGGRIVGFGIMVGRIVEGHPEHFEDAVGVAFERAETAVVGHAPDLDRFVAAAGEDEAAAATGQAVVAGDGRGVFGGELDGPDATAVTAQHALDFAFFDRPYLDGAILGRGSKEGRIMIDGDGVDVFVVSFAGEYRAGGRLPVGFGGVFRCRFPSLDRAVLGAGEEESGRVEKRIGGRLGTCRWSIPGQRDGA